MPPVRAYLALGSNLGDRRAMLEAATSALLAGPGIRVIRSSRVYETSPVGGPPQPDYLNAVLEVDTTLDPHALLEACLEVEARLGRERRERFGPRTIDVDVLTYGGLTIEEPDLVVPHPRMHERGFVMAPLLELDPDPPLPGGRRVAELPTSVIHDPGVRPTGPPLVGP